MDLLPLIERFADWSYAHIDEIKKAQLRKI